jgi:hypothetical protein
MQGCTYNNNKLNIGRQLGTPSFCISLDLVLYETFHDPSVGISLEHVLYIYVRSMTQVNFGISLEHVLDI